MVCRRWRVWALVSLAGLLSLAAAPSGAVPAPPYTAKQMENPPPTASGDPQKPADIRITIEAKKPSSNVEAAAYGEKVADEFTKTGQGVNSKDEIVRLNSAILIRDLATISSDRDLEKMLTNPDPAIRYWAARGLEDIAGDLKLVGGGGNAVKALTNAVRAEKSGVVIQEIIKALTAYGDPAAIRVGLKAVIALMSTSQPDVEMLHAAAAGIDALAPTVATSPAADKAETASIAAATASLAAQHYAAYADTLAAGGESMPKPYEDATHDVVAAAAKVAAAAAGKTYSTPSGATPAEFLLKVNTLFGSPGESNGTLQKDLPAVTAPPKVSAAAS